MQTVIIPAQNAYVRITDFCLGNHLTCNKYCLQYMYFLIYLPCSPKFLFFSLDTLSPSLGGTPVPQSYRIRSVSVFIHLKHNKTCFFLHTANSSKGLCWIAWQRCDNCAGNFSPCTGRDRKMWQIPWHPRRSHPSCSPGGWSFTSTDRFMGTLTAPSFKHLTLFLFG